MWLGRWARARHWLAARSRRHAPVARVMDVGCAIGTGTRELARVRGVRWVGGLDPDGAYLAQTRRSLPATPLVMAGAEALPVRSGSLDVVALLDVIEHLADPRTALAEASRVLAPGGTLLLSVPHAGALAALDSLNVYDALRRRMTFLPPLEHGERSAGARHAHFSRGQVAALLPTGLRISRSQVTGLGLAEVVHLLVLLLARVACRSERLYGVLRYLYYTAYLVEDLVPVPGWGYHLMIEAHRYDWERDSLRKGR